MFMFFHLLYDALKLKSFRVGGFMDILIESVRKLDRKYYLAFR